MKRSTAFAISATVSLGLFGAASASCGGEGSGGSSSSATSSSSSGSGGHGGHGGGGSGMYTPQGCSFSIAARPEYKGFQLAAKDTAATPNIRRVRLGLGGNVTPGAAGRADPSTSVGVAWQTDDGTSASEITWGDNPDPATWPASNRASGVTWLTPKGDLGGLDDERMHEVYLCGLTPATTYYYRVGGGPAGGEVWSEVYSFATTPAPGAPAVKIGITGDSRGQNNDAWRLLQRRMSLSGVNLMLFSGDMVTLASDQAEWEKWLDNAWKDSDNSLLTSGRILTLTTHGNHENHTSLFYGNVVMPQEPAAYPSYTELFYSVDVGPVHIVVVDDFWVGSSGDANYAATLKTWLDKDLDAANKNRANVPWIMAMHHHGEFSSSNHGTDADVLKGRAFFVPIWDQYHVDLVVDGHDHNYERTKPLTGPADNPTIHTMAKDGTVYVVCAGSGAPAYSKGMSAFTELSFDFKTTGVVGVYGYLTISPTQIAVEAHSLNTDGTDPIIDTFAIDKP